ncbi:unnamed protein product [Amoebophrya sp. A25]|nr:unnamed protein product [Amoebophrya sp. A25]|eukprot:GSA25T00000068001.1
MLSSSTKGAGQLSEHLRAKRERQRRLLAGESPGKSSSITPSQASSSSKQGEKTSRSNECPMCGELMLPRTAKRLPCGHGFHFDCIDPYIRRELMRNPKDPPLCPTCRHPILETVESTIARRKKKLEDLQSGQTGPLAMCVPSPRGRLSHNLRKYGRGEDYYEEVQDLWNPSSELSTLRQKRQEACEQKNVETTEDALFESRDAEIREHFRRHVEDADYELAVPEFLKSAASSSQHEAATGSRRLSTGPPSSSNSYVGGSTARGQGSDAGGNLNTAQPVSRSRATASVTVGTTATSMQSIISESPVISSSRDKESSLVVPGIKSKPQVVPLAQLESESPVRVPGLKLTPRKELRNQDLMIYRDPVAALRLAAEDGDGQRSSRVADSIGLSENAVGLGSPRGSPREKTAGSTALTGMKAPARRKNGALSKMHNAMVIADEFFSTVKPTLELSANRRLNDPAAKRKAGKRGGVKFAE